GVARRVCPCSHCPYYVVHVVDVYFAVNHDEHLCQGQLPHPPKPHHYFFRLTGILLFYRYYRKTLEPAGRRHGKVDHLWVEHLDKGKERAFYDLANVRVFKYRFADHGCKVNGLAAPHDGGQSKSRKRLCRRVVAGVVAKRPFY